MNVGKLVLSNYERSVLRTSKRSKADILHEDKRTKALMNRMLATKVKQYDDDGKEIGEVSAEELIMASAIEKEINNSKGFESINSLAKLRGEVEDKAVEVNISLVDKDLAERAVGDDDK